MAGKGHTGQVPRAGGGLVATPSAREMFEALGYEYHPGPWGYQFSYIKKGVTLEEANRSWRMDKDLPGRRDQQYLGDTVVYFHASWKQWNVTQKYYNRTSRDGTASPLIGVELTQAISQQLLELIRDVPTIY